MRITPVYITEYFNTVIFELIMADYSILGFALYMIVSWHWHFGGSLLLPSSGWQKYSWTLVFI